MLPLPRGTKKSKEYRDGNLKFYENSKALQKKNADDKLTLGKFLKKQCSRKRKKLEKQAECQIRLTIYIRTLTVTCKLSNS